MCPPNGRLLSGLPQGIAGRAGRARGPPGPNGPQGPSGIFGLRVNAFLHRVFASVVCSSGRRYPHLYSPVSNIGDIWSLEEGADESSIVLDIDKVGLDVFLQQFV
jgi:hypothetical protein